MPIIEAILAQALRFGSGIPLHSQQTVLWSMAARRSASIVAPCLLCIMAVVASISFGTTFVSPPKAANHDAGLYLGVATSTAMAMTNSMPAMAADVDPAEAYQQKIITGGSYVVMFSLFLAGLLIQQARKLVENKWLN